MTESSTLMCSTASTFEEWCVVIEKDTHKSESCRYVDQNGHGGEAENLFSFCGVFKVEDPELSRIKFTILRVGEV